MTLHKKTLCLCLTSALLGSIPAANATNGIFLIGYGAKARAMGGAQIAMSDDAIDGTMNPAALSFGEERLDAGLMIFNPQRRAACCNALDGTDPEGEVSDIPYYFIPNFAMSMKINDDLSWGFGFLGYGGGGTDYSQNFFDLGDTGRLGIEYTLAVMSPSLAYKINETQSVGMSLLIGVQRFRAYGLQAFTRFSVSPENVHENGLDYSVGGGLRLGWQMHAMQDRLELGASYSSKIYMQKFGKYKGLFAEQGNMDVPGNVTLGVAYKPVDPLTVAFDVERVFYQSVRAIGNRTLPISASSDPNDPNKMGQDTGPGFGWKDQTIFKLGVEYMIDKHGLYAQVSTTANNQSAMILVVVNLKSTYWLLL